MSLGMLPKYVLENVPQPKLVRKNTEEIWVLVRDDVAANGKLYIAPVGMLTSMRSIKPDELKEHFDWYQQPSPAVPVRETTQGPLNVEPLSTEYIQTMKSQKELDAEYVYSVPTPVYETELKGTFEVEPVALKPKRKYKKRKKVAKKTS